MKVEQAKKLERAEGGSRQRTERGRGREARSGGEEGEEASFEGGAEDAEGEDEGRAESGAEEKVMSFVVFVSTRPPWNHTMCNRPLISTKTL